jgi:hypothetical protein
LHFALCIQPFPFEPPFAFGARSENRKARREQARTRQALPFIDDSQRDFPKSLKYREYRARARSNIDDQSIGDCRAKKEEAEASVNPPCKSFYFTCARRSRTQYDIMDELANCWCRQLMFKERKRLTECVITFLCGSSSQTGH